MLLTNPYIDRLPNIEELRDVLLELQERYPVLHKKPYEREVNDSNQFILTPLEGGKYSLKPNITRQGLLYHGINGVKNPYFSGFYRMEKTERSCELLNIQAFLLTAESYPLFSLLKDGIDLGGGKRFVVYNPIGLAACYGYRTPFIQLTSSLDTAIMYATTSITQNGGLRYINLPDDQKKGTLYVFELYTTFSKIGGLSSVGLQAFERPGRMQEFAYLINKGVDFNELRNVKGFTFRHDYNVEKKLLNEIHRPKRADILSMKISKVYRPNAEGKIELPIEVLDRTIQSDLENRVTFVENDLSRFQFSKEELTSVNLEQRWYRMLEQVVPLIPSDQRIIDKLMAVPSKPQYRKYFDVSEWMYHLQTRKINE